jgi:hypothetical protein
MESLAIAIFILGGLVAAPVFCFLLVKVVRPYPLISRVVSYGALASMFLFGTDLLLVGVLGAVKVREVVGPVFMPLHALLTLGSAPALASALLLRQRDVARWWPAVAALSWVLGVFSIFYQYGVAEALYGIDGEGGPYSEL